MILRVIKVALKEVLKDRGKTLYALAKETGVSYNQLWKINKNDVKGITWDVLEKLCNNLECEPSDLIKILPDQQQL